MVIPPANTGNDNNNKIAVKYTAQTNKGNLFIDCPPCRKFIIVVIKLIAPPIEDAPAKCKLKIAKSTDGPVCVFTEANGGYTVQPVPAPNSGKLEVNNKINAGGNNQKLKLFSLGKAMSGAPNITGTIQLPKPPISIGITIKKIITNAWAVTTTLYN